jgi:FkbM family methyltransferase
MEVHPADLIGRDIMETGCYEPETVDFVQAFLKPGMTFFDIGANIGQYSLLGSGLVGPNGVVHAFEPDPLVCDVLQRNLRLNGCDNVVPNRAAVARQDGTQALCLSISDGLGTTSLSPSLYDSGLREQVKTVCLDSYARSRSLPRVDLMKLDIEGAELQALQGAEMVLREYPDVVLILEFCELNARRFGHSVPELAAYLRDRGFQLFKIMPGGIQAYTGKDPDLPDNKYDNVIAARRPELLPAGNGHQPKR